MTTTPAGGSAEPVPGAAGNAAGAAAAAPAAGAAGAGASPEAGGAPKAGSGEAGKPAAAAAGAPEKYSLTLPEGGHLEAGDLAQIETIARAAGWTNEEAQAAVEEHNATIAAQAGRYLDETRADATYGGDQLPQTQKLAELVINRVRPEGHARRASFLRFMTRGGAGNHIEVVSFLADLGKLLSEDGAVGGRGGNAPEVGAAEKLYGGSGGTA